MRPYVSLFGSVLVLGAITTAVFAQPRPGARPGRPGRPAARADAATNGDATATVAPASPLDGGVTDAANTVTSAVVDTDASTVTIGDAAFPMRQVGSGTLVHFPVPEQFARTAVPVFAQVRSSAPVDHVSLFYRGLGARRYTELRMQAMGQQFRLASGFGAMVPCEDVFPPKVQYYIEVIDSSGAPNGRAGTAETPIEVPVVDVRHYAAPTLPGQTPPATCGTLTVGATRRDAGTGPVEPPRGTADLGEPCQTATDCRRGLRCGATHQCVFDR
jgi:hypothetical protein